MKCYFCEAEARGICSECSRGTCEVHSTLNRSSRIAGGTEFKLLCKECSEST